EIGIGYAGHLRVLQWLLRCDDRARCHDTRRLREADVAPLMPQTFISFVSGRSLLFRRSTGWDPSISYRRRRTTGCAAPDRLRTNPAMARPQRAWHQHRPQPNTART